MPRDNQIAGRRITSYNVCYTKLLRLLAQTLLVQRLRLAPTHLLVSGLPLLLVGFVLLPLAGNIPALVGVLGILGLGMGLIAPGFTAGASLAVGADEQGAVGGLVSACPAAGFILGPMLGTTMYQHIHVLPYFCAAGLMLPLLVYA